MKKSNPLFSRIQHQLGEERFKMIEKPSERKKFNLQIIMLLSVLSGLIMVILKILSVFK